jgi:hypothetical protein
LFEHEEFVQAVNIFHWWGSKPEIGIDQLLSYSDRRVEDDFRGPYEDDEDIKYVHQKLKENFSPSNPYWLSYPGECVELNNIVTFTLLKLLFPEKEFFSTCINLNGENADHNVITSKKLNNGEKFKFDTSLVDEDEGLILYDLIYPFCFWYGKTFETRENVEFIISGDISRPLPEGWQESNYTAYYAEHGIPFETDYIPLRFRTVEEPSYIPYTPFLPSEYNPASTSEYNPASPSEYNPLPPSEYTPLSASDYAKLYANFSVPLSPSEHIPLPHSEYAKLLNKKYNSLSASEYNPALNEQFQENMKNKTKKLYEEWKKSNSSSK